MARAAVDRIERQHSDGQPNGLHASGTHIGGAFRCCECGYGVVSREPLPTCPMCRGGTWQESSWRPFTRDPRRR
jgi:rubrerythrin